MFQKNFFSERWAKLSVVYKETLYVVTLATQHKFMLSSKKWIMKIQFWCASHKSKTKKKKEHCRVDSVFVEDQTELRVPKDRICCSIQPHADMWMWPHTPPFPLRGSVKLMEQVRRTSGLSNYWKHLRIRSYSKVDRNPWHKANIAGSTSSGILLQRNPQMIWIHIFSLHSCS